MVIDEKLRELEAEFSRVEAQLAAPETYNNPERVAKLNREHRQLAPVVECWRCCQQCRGSLAEAEELAHSSDPELSVLAQEEMEAARQRLRALEQQLKILLLPRDPDDDRDVILEIRAGVGGEEAALFAGSLQRMYEMYAARRGWQMEVISLNSTELGGIREIVCALSGEGVYASLRFESGVHRVQRVPETESGGRIHTSTVTVAVLPQVDEVELELDPRDLRIDTFRSSGAGGQHINKTESAIRITHLPTGTVVECQDERSQFKNKARAMQVLRSRLYEAKVREREEEQSAQRRGQVGTGMRNERIRTYNFPQGRVTDHRIGLTLYQLGAVVDGDLDLIIRPLMAARQAELLRQSD